MYEKKKKILVPLVKIIIGIVKYLEENVKEKSFLPSFLFFRSPPEGTETKNLIFIYLFSFLLCVGMSVCVCVELRK